ncbi:uncharacterized protein LOC120711448 [Panicum virgatum]|uniref:uncharacterized protein LOC120711448 n=1 Tax=Panicum virgatum TaxID=38727 RepID=UPI0019D5A64D|nr:uncharacterized protein LOC120711448 [Panicum virgatum]XP_039852902.1 uncharacterized protein LOC120711448 [Panicum virgatum]
MFLISHTVLRIACCLGPKFVMRGTLLYNLPWKIPCKLMNIKLKIVLLLVEPNPTSWGCNIPCNGVLLAFGRTSNQTLLLLVHILYETHLLLFLVNYVVLECYYYFS